MNTQRPPKSDLRYRVHRSVKCYVADLACGTGGCTWYFSDSIERVVYLTPERIEKVQYQNHLYALQPPERMNEIVQEQLRLGGAVHIGGKAVAGFQADQSFTPYPFIEVVSPEDRAFYERLKARK